MWGFHTMTCTCSFPLAVTFSIVYFPCPIQKSHYFRFSCNRYEEGNKRKEKSFSVTVYQVMEIAPKGKQQPFCIAWQNRAGQSAKEYSAPNDMCWLRRFDSCSDSKSVVLLVIRSLPYFTIPPRQSGVKKVMSLLSYMAAACLWAARMSRNVHKHLNRSG